MRWTEIILGVLTLLGGCAWFVNFRKDKQEAKGIRADNRQKEMDLSKMYVDELTFGLPPSRLGNAHASMALRSAWRRFNLNIVVPLQQRVQKLESQIERLHDAIEGINSCPYRAECPVLGSLAKPTR